ncbi:hypothetical protein HMPREF1584_00636 [Gardnerella vaginalis JCP8481A]|nr:hypothetical protein HMPREF1584_00636 [Gardnerella vaginalis JCP8481A]
MRARTFSTIVHVFLIVHSFHCSLQILPYPATSAHLLLALTARLLRMLTARLLHA